MKRREEVGRGHGLGRRARVAAVAAAVLAAAPAVGAAGCASEHCPTGTGPAICHVERVVPSDALRSAVEPMTSNNNLDLVEHDGRLFFAFRTAPSHFASAQTELHVVSAAREGEWEDELTVTMGTDLREPRLLSWNGQLFLYFAVLGVNPLDFEPMGMMAARRIGRGDWTAPEWFYEPGFIPWRAKVVDGVPYLIAYVGGENIYDIDGEPVEVRWLTTQDGLTWEPVVPGQAAVHVGGSSETDFVLLDDGSLVAVMRNEAGEASGWGSNICRAAADSLGDWTCVNDPKKYDSPLLFRHGAEVWLIARRNVTETGYYDLMLPLSPGDATLQNLIDYSSRPKRCALWRVDPEKLAVTWELDLPSYGDTCFASAVPLSDDDFLVYNYSSDLEAVRDTDPSWFEAQYEPTNIYRFVLSFPKD
ncbi:MAG TPA: hypothetical protein VG389_20140 [Myxococcota bacterium]|jgi:hypothetical protein|nr:hypothetical protein [Myxococcota bacterium]